MTADSGNRTPIMFGSVHLANSCKFNLAEWQINFDWCVKKYSGYK